MTLMKQDENKTTTGSCLGTDKCKNLAQTTLMIKRSPHPMITTVPPLVIRV